MKYFAGTSVVPTLSRLVLALAFITAGYNKLFNDKPYTEQEAQTLKALDVELDRRPADLQDQQQLEASRLIIPVALRQEEPDPAPDLPEQEPPEQEQPLEEEVQEEVDETADELEEQAEDLQEQTEDLQDEPAPPDPEEAAELEEDEEYVYYGKQLHSVTLLVNKGDWPYPQVLAWIAAMTEFFGGICLLIGFLSRFWALGIAIAMASAFYLASWNVYHVYELANNPLDFGKPGNMELYNMVLTQLGLFVLSFGIVLTGPGPLSLDRLLFGRRHKEEVVVKDE